MTWQECSLGDTLLSLHLYAFRKFNMAARFWLAKFKKIFFSEPVVRLDYAIVVVFIRCTNFEFLVLIENHNDHHHKTNSTLHQLDEQNIFKMFISDTSESYDSKPGLNVPMPMTSHFFTLIENILWLQWHSKVLG